MAKKIRVGKMSLADRAKQFAPFAALTGLGAVIKDQEKIITPRHDITDELANELSKTVAEIKKGDIVSVTYYDKDGYITKVGIVSQIDLTFKVIVVVKTKIVFSDIYSLSIVNEN